MKLDKIKFARLVQCITHAGWNGDIEDLDVLIDINVTPVEVPGKADPVTVDTLMKLMAGGGQIGAKIEAIKLYRQITSCMLKESKDAVEKYWVNKPDEPATLGEILDIAAKARSNNRDDY